MYVMLFFLIDGFQSIFRGALEAYVKTVSAKGGTEYAPVYPVMLELLQKGLNSE